MSTLVTTNKPQHKPPFNAFIYNNAEKTGAEVCFASSSNDGPALKGGNQLILGSRPQDTKLVIYPEFGSAKCGDAAKEYKPLNIYLEPGAKIPEFLKEGQQPDFKPYDFTASDGTNEYKLSTADVDADGIVDITLHEKIKTDEKKSEPNKQATEFMLRNATEEESDFNKAPGAIAEINGHKTETNGFEFHDKTSLPTTITLATGFGSQPNKTYAYDPALLTWPEGKPLPAFKYENENKPATLKQVGTDFKGTSELTLRSYDVNGDKKADITVGFVSPKVK